MSERWIDTKNDSHSLNRLYEYWEALRDDINTGEFWADKKSEDKEGALNRLGKALDALPLPAAFREAAVATRSLIKEKRKEKVKCETELSLLYWLAAIRSFMLKDASKLREPGFNVIAYLPAKIVETLSYTYNELGYEKLELLNKTDRKWLLESWGEPNTHKTLYELHKAIWDECAAGLIEKRKPENEQHRQDLVPNNVSTERKLPIQEEQPAVQKEQPAVQKEQPAVPMDQPAVSKEQLAVPMDQPAVSKEQRAVPMDQPAVSKEQRAIPKEQPAVSNEQPAISKEQPAISKEQPAISNSGNGFFNLIIVVLILAALIYGLLLTI